MAGTNGTGAEQLVGRVLSVNEKGLRLEGREGWVNFSKFARDLTPPTRGALVALSIDKSGIIRRVEAVEGDVPGAGKDAGAGKDRTITRLALLKAAAEWSVGRSEIKSGDVLKVVERWEAWVSR
jgi:hypothetical protein